MDLLPQLNGKGMLLFDNAENYLKYEFDKDNLTAKSLVTSINTNLEKKESQSKGLILLVNSLCQISEEAFVKYFALWISKTLQILANSPTKSEELRIACNTIATLITKCKKIPELDKGVSIHNVKQIVLAILKHYDQDKNYNLLNLLSVLLYHYPESCSRFQASFMKIVTSCIDEKDKRLVYSGAKCYSLLVRVNERQAANSSKDNFKNVSDSSAKCHISHQIDLCNNLYILMDELFQDLTTECTLPYKLDKNININKLELHKILCQDIFEYYAGIENRFSNICIYLSTLLKIGGSERKRFAIPNLILQTILTCVEISPENLQKNFDKSKKKLLLLMLPRLHANLLHILTTLIASFQQELIPSALKIQSLILQILQYTQQSNRNCIKSLRILTYQTLSMWLKEVRALSGFQIMADEFFSHILHDIIPSDKNITNIPVVKNEMKKSKLAESYHTSLNVCDSHKLSITKDSNFLLNILITVQSIVINNSGQLKPFFYDIIKKLVVLLLHERYTKNSIKIINTSLLYELLKTLRLLQMYAHTSVSSPTSYAIEIFTIVLSQEKNIKLINEANLGLAELCNTINPTAPTIRLLSPGPVSGGHNLNLSEFVSAIQHHDSVNNLSKRIRLD